MKETIEKFYIDLKKTRKLCPWSKDQTILKQIEELKSEIIEVEKALKNNDNENLKEELGDIFWDTLFLLVLSEEEKGFDIKEVIENARAKLNRRKPWVFGDMKVNSREEAIKVWNEIKKKEKKK